MRMKMTILLHLRLKWRIEATRVYCAIDTAIGLSRLVPIALLGLLDVARKLDLHEN